jgi:prepilin-type N-terminal cleavage/methylation domain-containing protein
MASTPALRRQGFTLVEILSVVAIVAILAALLFPVLARAKSRAKAATCISNLGQLGKATQLYQGSNDDGLPLENPREDVVLSPTRTLRSYTDPLIPFGMVTAVYHCPDAKIEDRDVDVRSDFRIRFVVRPVRLSTGDLETWRQTPETGSVLAYCPYHGHHLTGPGGDFLDDGTFNVLRYDGSVRSTPSKSVHSMDWNWEPFAGKYDPATNAYLRFPDEPWPPQLTFVR